MQAPPQKRSISDRDLIVLPEARAPLPRWVAFAIAGAAAVALVAGAGAMLTALRGELRERDAVIAAATERAVAAEADAHRAAVQNGALEARVTDLREQLDQTRARSEVVGASRAELRRQLARARRDLDQARARIASLAGASTEDGRHLAILVAVGGTQEPPRLVIDLARWFRGERARRAAIADGAIDPGDVLPRGRYVRNARPGWRTVALDPDATVSVRGWRGHGGVTVISIDDLQRAMRSDRYWARRIRHDPFWVTVEGGRVTTLRQQRYP
jgi:hypothetical protein